MKESTNRFVIASIIAFIVVMLAVIGTYVMMEQALYPRAVIIEPEKPPFSLDVFVQDDEIWIRPLDVHGDSTKFPGNAQIQLASVYKTDGESFSYTPMLTNVVHINHFDLIYYNNRGNASNVYAATSEINMPDTPGLYRIAVTYYPAGQYYSVSKEIYRGV